MALGLVDLAATWNAVSPAKFWILALANFSWWTNSRVTLTLPAAMCRAVFRPDALPLCWFSNLKYSSVVVTTLAVWHRRSSSTSKTRHSYNALPFLQDNLGKLAPVLMKQETMGVAVASSGRYANHLHLAPNDATTPSLNVYRPDALADAQPTVSKHWKQVKASNRLVLYCLDV